MRAFDAAYFLRGDVVCLAGVDEAGRGCLAGPVAAAAVLVDKDSFIEGINDSKKLSPSRREALEPLIREKALASAVGWASAQEVDRLNVLGATLLAAGRALEALASRPDLILSDYLRLDWRGRPVEALVKGDARSQAIAAASVLAKVARDRWMVAIDAEYPDYGFAAHKGYGTAAHLEALRRHGACTLHRHSFRGVDCFEEEYRSSRTLGRILTALRDGRLGPAEAQRNWQEAACGLPECEERIFQEARLAPVPGGEA